jgi:hypothetical protein
MGWNADTMNLESNSGQWIVKTMGDRGNFTIGHPAPETFSKGVGINVHASGNVK